MFGRGCEDGMCGTGMEGAPRGGMCVVRIERVERADYADALMNWAKTEIVKEKVKAKLEAKYGKQLDKLADTIMDVMVERAEGRKKAGQKAQKMKEAEEELPFDDSEGLEVL